MNSAENTYYKLGYRDALAGVCAIIRIKGNSPNAPVTAIREVAKNLLKINPENPHGQWVLDNVKEGNTREP